MRDAERDWQPRTGLSQPGKHDRSCCMQCTETNEVCACPVRHAAYTTKACKCWHYPSSIFLVSKKLNSIARRLFFSRNRFVFWDTCKDGNRVDKEPGPQYKYLVETSKLLQGLPSHALLHMRWICLSFRTFGSSDALPDTAGHQSWKEVTSLIKQQMWTSRLTVELNFIPPVPDYASQMEDPEDTDNTWLTYQNIVGIFKLQDSPFEDFFVRLASPKWNNLQNDMTRWKRERILEKRVMGDGYNAAARGKYRDYSINEESAPRRFWYDFFGISPKSNFDLDDPKVQARLLADTVG